MNRAFYIVGGPAFVTSVCWLTFVYGWRKAIPLTLLEVALIAGGVIFVRRRFKTSSQ
ncbi:MAG: hypothetical protein WA755_11855 [Candidatus Acidiferrales bacterium]